MFASLNQGSIIYILDKVDKPKFKIGEIISISSPKQLFNTFTGTNQLTIDIKVNIDGSTYEYNAIPSHFSTVSYNSGKITISETKQGLLLEVESILLNSKLIINNIESYKLTILSCESILKDLNPLFAKDKERDIKLDNLEVRMNTVDDKLERILNLVTNKNNAL